VGEGMSKPRPNPRKRLSATRDLERSLPERSIMPTVV